MKTSISVLQRHLLFWALSSLLSAILLAPAAETSTFRKAKTYQVTNLETINDDLYVWANRFHLQGIVMGDVSSFSYFINTGGQVTQSANLFGREITHSGKVDGSYRAFGEVVRLQGYIGRSALLFGREVTVANGSVIERDLSVFGAEVFLEGAVKGNVSLRGGHVQVSGVIAGDVTIEADEIDIIKPAVILGSLTYTSKQEATIELDQGVTIGGGATWNQPKKDEEEKDPGYTSVVLRISSFFAAFLFGIIVTRLFRPYAEESLNQVRSRFSVSFAAGLLGIVLLVLCFLVLIFAVITMVAGLIIINTEAAPFGALILIFALLMIPISSFLSITGTIVFYSGKIVIALLVGYLIMRRVRTGVDALSRAALFLGLVITYLLFAIPCLGFFVYMFLSIVGAGAIILGIKHCRSPQRIQLSPARPQEPPLPVPPPPVGPSGSA